MADDLSNFQWTGIDKSGKRVSGQIKATNAHTAEGELKQKNIEITSIKEKKQMRFTLFQKKIKDKEIVLLTRYLSTMIEAGMPIMQSLDIIATDQENETLRNMVNAIKKNVSAGRTLAESLELYPENFDTLYCNLVRAGEKSGTLDKVLKRLSIYLEQARVLKSKIKHALIYPTTIVFIAMGVSLVLLLFVVPQFQVMFKNSGVPLPGITQAVINISDFIRSCWYILIGLIVGAYFFYRRTLKSSETFQYWMDKHILRLYVVGAIIEKAIIARFTGTLAITLEAGLPIVDSMKTMVNIMGNKVYADAIQEVCDDVVAGHELSKAMARTKLFPNMTIQMIAVGEASGKLPDMLINIAKYYQEEVNDIADNLSTLLEPIIIVILGVIIGVFVVAMYMPIFKIGSTVH